MLYVENLPYMLLVFALTFVKYMLYFYTRSKQKHAFPFPPDKYSMFVSMIFSIIIIKVAWASIEKKKKMWTHEGP
jgi:hypothetical protein